MPATKLSNLRGPPDRTGLATSMTAAVQDRYGPDPRTVLRSARTALPALGDDDVLVRVRASSVDRGTWHLMSGLPYPIRLAGFGLRRPKNANPGQSLAGTVEAVGGAVTGLGPGDEVYGTGTSTFAEYAAARSDRLAPKPANLSFDDAAAVPMSGVTALQAVRDHAHVRAGETVLVIGASGGVGSFAVQIAKAVGATVTGVCSTGKQEMVRALGADAVIDYRREDFTDAGTRFDVVLDIGGNASLSRLRRALGPRGRLVIVGGETDGRWLGGNDRQLRAQALSWFVRQHLGTFVASQNAADLLTLRDLIEAGKVTPAVDRSYPLAEVAAAIRHLLDGTVRGKLVVSVSAGGAPPPATRSAT